MDPRGALVVLGIARPTSTEAVRRAYLKLVRTRPPERDPDGFREVRAAYELLKEAPGAWLATEESGAALPSEEEPPSEAAVLAPSKPPEASPDGPHPTGGDPREPRSTPLQLVTTADAGLPPLVAAIRARDAATAVAIVLEVLEGRPTERSRGFAPWHVLEVTVGLLVKADYTNAELLLRKFDAWTSALGVGSSDIGSQWVARWTLLKELVSLHGQIDENVLAVLVEAVRTSNFNAALQPLERAQERDESFESRLKRAAPTLYKVLWPRVLPQDETVKKLRRRPGLRGVGVVFGVLYLVIRVLGATDEPHSRPLVPDPGRLAALAEKRHAGLPVTAPDTPVAESGDLLGARIDRSVANGDCQDVRDSWPPYAAAARGAAPALGGRTYAARRESAVQMCEELRSILPEKP